MGWPDYDTHTVNAGSSSTTSVGDRYGLVLYVAPAGKVTEFTVSVKVDDTKGRTGFGGCHISVTQRK